MVAMHVDENEKHWAPHGEDDYNDEDVADAHSAELDAEGDDLNRCLSSPPSGLDG